MIDSLILMVAAAGGLVLGGVFFGGLWWTIRRGTVSPHPARWFLGSLLLRIGLVMSGFYYIGGSSMPRWGVCLIGFIVARVIVSRATRLPATPLPLPTEGTRHAS